MRDEGTIASKNSEPPGNDSPGDSRMVIEFCGWLSLVVRVRFDAN